MAEKKEQWALLASRLSDLRKDQEFPPFQPPDGRNKSADSGATDSHKSEFRKNTLQDLR